MDCADDFDKGEGERFGCSIAEVGRGRASNKLRVDQRLTFQLSERYEVAAHHGQTSVSMPEMFPLSNTVLTFFSE